jgi:hypothetical protein
VWPYLVHHVSDHVSASNTCADCHRTCLVDVSESTDCWPHCCSFGLNLPFRGLQSRASSRKHEDIERDLLATRQPPPPPPFQAPEHPNFGSFGTPVAAGAQHAMQAPALPQFLSSVGAGGGWSQAAAEAGVTGMSPGFVPQSGMVSASSESGAGVYMPVQPFGLPGIGGPGGNGGAGGGTATSGTPHGVTAEPEQQSQLLSVVQAVLQEQRQRGVPCSRRCAANRAAVVYACAPPRVRWKSACERTRH